VFLLSCKGGAVHQVRFKKEKKERKVSIPKGKSPPVNREGKKVPKKGKKGCACVLVKEEKGGSIHRCPSRKERPEKGGKTVTPEHPEQKRRKETTQSLQRRKGRGKEKTRSLPLDGERRLYSGGR